MVDGKIIYQNKTKNIFNYFGDNFNLFCPEFSNISDYFMSKIHF
jgi:hypothetical protein